MPEPLGQTPSYLRSWEWSLRAADRSPHTIRTYRTRLGHFLGEVPDPTKATKHAVSDYLLRRRLDGAAPKTVQTDYVALLSFFRWLVEEGDISASPMVGVPFPKTTPPAVKVLNDSELRRLLAACAGSGFAERRDAAIIRLFLNSGMRRSELAGLTLEGLDLAGQLVAVMGKGRRPRIVPFGVKTSQALDRYLRVRAMHPARTCLACGWAVRARCLISGSTGSCRRGQLRRASTISTRTSSATRSLTSGSPTAVRR